MPKSKTKEVESFPVWSVDQEGDLERYEHIPTPASMKDTVLFGIPLTSAFTGDTIKDVAIQSYINQAISQIEHELDLYINPVTFHEKYDYDRHAFSWNYNYLKLNHPNVISVQEVELSFSNSTEVEGFVQFPLEHVHVMPQEGTLQLVPAFGTSLSGFLLSAFSGTQFHAMRAIGLDNFPGGLRIKYTCGFSQDRVPALITSLIENIAAYKLLTTLGPVLFPNNSVGISIDGVSQSVSTPGPQFLASRLADLEKLIEKETAAAAGYYQRKVLIDYI